ncbi:MAG: hypothetical protein JXA13_11045 [Anaerolineales bacterium]|nr:hypothetical protein [Anaerolineales bacterium]
MDYLELVGHDVFRYGGGLNGSAAEVYWYLLQESMTARELIESTGRGRSTVFRGLRRMSSIVDSRTGEILSMVESQDGVWSAVSPVDLNHIALILDTAGIGKRKAEQYEREKIAHKKDLRAWKNWKNDENSADN